MNIRLIDWLTVITAVAVALFSVGRGFGDRTALCTTALVLSVAAFIAVLTVDIARDLTRGRRSHGSQSNIRQVK